MDSKKTDQLRELLEMQASSCDCNNDSYFRGMYNGLELALATIEQRDPVYREAPKQPEASAGWIEGPTFDELWLGCVDNANGMWTNVPPPASKDYVDSLVKNSLDVEMGQIVRFRFITSPPLSPEPMELLEEYLSFSGSLDQLPRVLGVDIGKPGGDYSAACAMEMGQIVRFRIIESPPTSPELLKLLEECWREMDEAGGLPPELVSQEEACRLGIQSSKEILGLAPPDTKPTAPREYEPDTFIDDPMAAVRAMCKSGRG